MKKSILKLEGVTVLSKEKQKSISGGTGLDHLIVSTDVMYRDIPLGYPVDQSTCYFLYGVGYTLRGRGCLHHN